ncbi:MAG: threonylcarbamoyl-AMP synthase [Deltaproteobacteria bacterium]|nr:threonylcarbamoyl-AMP synthase [Deltaproteobacteria bacterium]
MIVAINPDNPQIRLVQKVVGCLQDGGVIAYPTDTIYGIGCDIFNKKAVKRIYQLKHRDPKKPFSFICSDLSDVTKYAQVSNFAFKIMKRRLPGPFTFVLEATRLVPDLLMTRQRTVGVRIPDNRICALILDELGHPLVTTSANISGENSLGDPSEIEEMMGKQLDLVVDGGILFNEPSTVISLLNDEVQVLRQGYGDTSWITNLD